MPNGNKYKKERFILLWGLCAIIVILIGMLTLYINLSGTVVKKETERSTKETAELVATTVTDRLNNVLHSLTLCAITCSEMDDVDAILYYLKEAYKDDNFVRLSFALPDGTCYTTDGFSFSIAGSDPYRKIVKEGAASSIDYISNSYAENSKPSIVCSVPVHLDGTFIGIVSASTGLDNLRETLFVNYLDGEAFFHIVRQDGSVILLSDNKNAVTGYTNYLTHLEEKGRSASDYPLAQVKTDMAQKKSNITYFTLAEDDMQKMMYYLPLGVEDWYLLSLVPSEYLQQSMSSILFFGIGIGVVILLLFLLLISIMLWNNNKNQKELEHLAFVDPVTQGFNRVKFELEAMKHILRMPPGSYFLMSVDIYQFKTLNDLAGGHEGNRALRHFYHTLQRHFPADMPVARISADMFDVLFPACSRVELEQKLQDVVDDVNAFNEQLENKYYFRLAAGVYPVDDVNPDIIAIQDRANIARKSLKHDCADRLYTLTVYDDEERLRQSREKEMMDRMEQALKNGEFLVYLQPKIDLKTNRVCSAEALVRWKDPTRGLIPPDEFIPLFERGGAIVKLDLYMFDQVCRLLHKWVTDGREPIPVSVNLSRVHLNNPNFLQLFIAIQKKHGISSELLEFEITESVAFENRAYLNNILQQMHQEGFRCSLDDFGSGYSSLNLLNEIPVDVIKLDREFFSTVPDRIERSKRIIQSVVSLAKSLNAKTVSEGVETKAQVDFLRSIECDMVQGFVFSRPLPITDFEEFVKHSNDQA